MTDMSPSVSNNSMYFYDSYGMLSCWYSRQELWAVKAKLPSRLDRKEEAGILDSSWRGRQVRARWNRRAGRLMKRLSLISISHGMAWHVITWYELLFSCIFIWYLEKCGARLMICSPSYIAVAERAGRGYPY